MTNIFAHTKGAAVACLHKSFFCSSAYNVMLKDDSFQSADFKTVKGQNSVQWSSIPPNGNVTHVLVVQPYKSGYFNFTAAQLSYEPTDGGEKQVGHSEDRLYLANHDFWPKCTVDLSR